MDFVGITNFFQGVSDNIITHPMFESLGGFFVFIWSVIPSAKIVPVEIFILALLQLGVSPVLLVIVASLGALTGDYIIYLLGKGIIHAVRGKPKKLVSADHLLHRYRHPIFFATPFLGILGDGIVFVAGIEHVGFKKMLPFLLIGQFGRFTIGMFALLGIIELPEFLGI